MVMVAGLQTCTRVPPKSYSSVKSGWPCGSLEPTQTTVEVTNISSGPKTQEGLATSSLALVGSPRHHIRSPATLWRDHMEKPGEGEALLSYREALPLYERELPPYPPQCFSEPSLPVTLTKHGDEK